jgi:hypothetical protein
MCYFIGNKGDVMETKKWFTVREMFVNAPLWEGYAESRMDAFQKAMGNIKEVHGHGEQFRANGKVYFVKFTNKKEEN